MSAHLQALGEWDKEVGVPIDRAISASMRVMGRTAFDATKQAVILMAQSARAMTPQSRSRRGIVRGTQRMGPYVQDWTGADRRGGVPSKIYRFFFSPDFDPNTIRDGAFKSSALAARKRFNSFDEARVIRMRGLAKASWMWGLRRLGGTGVAAHRDRHRVASAGSFKSDARGEAGHWINNALSYIIKVMPASWQSDVQRLAGNKMMAQARRRLENDFNRSMRQASSAGRGAALSGLRGILR